jgi:hypothetical protein
MIAKPAALELAIGCLMAAVAVFVLTAWWAG